MKKYLVTVLTLFTVVIWTSAVWAGGEINNSNWTSKSFREVAYADKDAIYNPAGLAFEERNFISTGVSAAFKNYCSGFPSKCADDTSYIPNLSLHYRYTDNLSFFGSYFIAAGGGKLTFDEGNALTQYAVSLLPGPDSPQKAEVESAYHALKYGISFKGNDRLGFAGGLMHVFGEKKADLQAGAFKVNVDQEADGLTLFGSMHYNYDDLWNFALNFTGPVRLNWESTVKQNDLLGLGGAPKGYYLNYKDVQEDLPASFSFGLKRTIPTDTQGTFELEAGVIYFMQQNSDVVWDDLFTYVMGGDNDRQKYFDDAFELSFGLTWEPDNSDWKYYLSYVYGDPNADPEYTSTFKPSLKFNTVGFGFDYKYTENIVFNFSASTTFYEKATKENGHELDKETDAIGIGIDYYF
jgi:long-subunit fatty acid transport protein